MLNNPSLQIKKTKISFGSKIIINNLDLTLEKGEIGCLIGHSGGGKTTLLRAIAGLLKINEGTIYIDNRLVSSKDMHVETENRGVGLLFQEYALYPHLTVKKNILFGLYKLPKKKQLERADYLIELFGLKDIIKSHPNQLSGGQQQRVALARAIAPSPKLLMLDEPFSNLDLELKEHLLHELIYLLKKTNTSTLVVTHDQQEAFSIGDKVGVLLNGYINQWGSPHQLFHTPKNRFVAEFIGDGIIIKGKMISDYVIETELGAVSYQFTLQNCPGINLEVLVRPDDIELDENKIITGKLIAKLFRGDQYMYRIRLTSGLLLNLYVGISNNHTIGSVLGVRLKNNQLLIFPPTIYSGYG